MLRRRPLLHRRLRPHPRQTRHRRPTLHPRLTPLRRRTLLRRPTLLRRQRAQASKKPSSRDLAALHTALAGVCRGLPGGQSSDGLRQKQKSHEFAFVAFLFAMRGSYLKTLRAYRIDTAQRTRV